MNINVFLILYVFAFHGNTVMLSLSTTGVAVMDKACTREVSFDQFDLYPIGNILETALKITGTKRLAVVFDNDYRFLGKNTAFSDIRLCGGFLRGGGNPYGDATLPFTIFSPKLHKKERNFGPGGGGGRNQPVYQ